MKRKRENNLDFSLMNVVVTPLLREYIRDKTLNFTDIEIMAAIQTVGGHRGYFSSTEFLAEALKISTRQVQKSLKKLKGEFINEGFDDYGRKCWWVVCEEIRGSRKNFRRKSYNSGKK